MSMMKKAALGGLAGLMLSTAAMAQDLSVEVYTNWVSGGESAALNAIAQAFEAKGGKWIDFAVPGDTVAPAISRIVAGDPMGAAKMQSTDLDELYKAGLLADIDQVATDGKWQERLPDFMWNAITRDGHVYGAPINSQSEVWLWYNKAVFEKLGLAEPQSYDELFASLDKIKEAGVIPFAVGGQDWQLNILFLKILAGVAPDVYLGLQGADYEAAINSDGFKQVAEIFGRLRGYDDEGSPGRQWNVAVNMVATGQAAMMVMGDWAKGEFTAAGQTAGKEYGCMLGPQGDSIILTGDMFIFPKIETQRPGQLLLAATMLEPATQVPFNIAKGSMPSTLDTDVTQMDACTQKAMAVLQDPAKRLPGLSYVMTPDRRAAISDAVAKYWSDEAAGPDALVAAMQEAFSSTN
ncbi:ABC transporter substrate-binding protein [Stagnihabitans tardus]|uniref:Probable sugar-binding periplasmic protein n=1 Tax=Stagnihabitans tardus TaxID=2699202 RepID=A0AAE4YES7_9RHOB|nr:ABC transporter substrate-binding protein [Stagnihabitans tardus]NBZ90008.1 extracellular solute-binding protein [Stagnihabitans tardus]